jgi:hypothetical protein
MLILTILFYINGIIYKVMLILEKICGPLQLVGISMEKSLEEAIPSMETSGASIDISGISMRPFWRNTCPRTQKFTNGTRNQNRKLLEPERGN